MHKFTNFGLIQFQNSEVDLLLAVFLILSISLLRRYFLIIIFSVRVQCFDPSKYHNEDILMDTNRNIVWIFAPSAHSN